MISHSPYQRVVNQQEMPGVSWFEGATLNYAELILAPGTQSESFNAPAIVAESETRPRVEVFWQSLPEQTGALTASLKQHGLELGDRAVAYLPNIPESVVALLSVSSCGAIWSAASPDMGIASVLDRFHQIEPKNLFTIDGYRYNGKDYDRREVVVDLVKQLPPVETVIFIPYLHESNELDLSAVREGKPPPVVSYAETVSTPSEPDFIPVPFAHSLWIVYSSGTTSCPRPSSIVMVESFPKVAYSLVVDLEYLGKPSYLALFVVLTDPETAPTPNAEVAGKASRTEKPSLRDTGIPETLRSGIMNKIRTNLSGRHTPNEIFAIQAVPYTISGKKMEVPIKKILLGKSAATSANRDSMSNPESIDWFVEFARGRNF